jgi:RNA-directed DNA polymerase
LEGDIAGCFDHISHAWMLDHIPTDKVMLRKWLKAGYVYGNQLFPTEAGTPQGGIISPTLMNMTLDGLESRLKSEFGQKGSNDAHANQINLVRYADDFIITGRSKERLEHEVKPLVESFLKERGLALSGEKTRITHVDEGFDFLGWNIRKYDGKLLSKPSRKNVKAFLEDLRETIKTHRQAKQENLIGVLNPKIQGWVNYHKGSVATVTFARVDKEIWQLLWRWAKRRHPNKGARWIKERYFKTEGNQHWVFAADIRTPEGKPIRVTLVQARNTKIRRHIKIRSEANPYDPEQETYFENRLGWKMKDSLTGKVRLLRIWWNQDKRCPLCAERITQETGWQIHHLLPKSEGGKDNVSNLVLVHPNCHRQIHSRKLRS